MSLTSIFQSLFGNKYARDKKLVQPIVDKVKDIYPEIEALDDNQLRAKTKEIQRYVQDSAAAQKEEIQQLILWKKKQAEKKQSWPQIQGC